MPEVTRLYPFFKPNRYDIRLKANKVSLTFSGSAVIAGNMATEQKELKLHSKDLIIESVKVDGRVATFKIAKKSDEIHIKLPSSYTGELKVTLKFKGIISRQMHGLYPCHASNGEVYLATQFESHHAREVFPCIDEPEAKAVFSLTVITNKTDKVISNMLPKTVTESGNLSITLFEDTPLMSTYLLALVVGNIEYTEGHTNNGTLVRVWSAPEQTNQHQFALQTTIKCLEFFNNYFGIDYPLPKCDMIALPDFGASSIAMENWGLITFREAYLLVDDTNTSLEMKQCVASVIAHELAHQWFGNLVTMRWWNDLWLNEGFASWLDYLAVNQIFPDWHVWSQFLSSEQQMAFRLDALKNTHAIEVKIHHPDEICNLFDTISYSKGASIVHMLHGYLGDRDFRTGLQNYLSKFAYCSADTKDLYASLEESSQKPVSSFMSVWTKKPGFPLLECRKTTTGVSIRQNRFSNEHVIKDSTLWPIPLLSSVIKEPVLSEYSQTFSVTSVNQFKLNEDQSGFYITKYWPKHYESLGKSLAKGKLNESERLGLLSDMLALTKSGRLPLLRLLKILIYFKNETSAPVWDIILLIISDIRRVMGPDVREAIKPFILDLTSIQLARLGWSDLAGEPYFDKLLRQTILSLSGSADSPEVVKQAYDIFSKANAVEQIPTDLRSTVLMSVSRRGGRLEFDRMLDMYHNTTSGEYKEILSHALANFRNASEYKRALSMIKSPDVKLQDVFLWIASMLSNYEARDTAWKWLRTNWPWVKANLHGDSTYFIMPVYIGRAYNHKSFIAEYKAFFIAIMEPGLKLSYRQGLETIKNQAAWRKRDELKLLKWLSAFKSL
jgi:aminopeptidase N